MPKRPVIERLMARTVKTKRCWLYQGATNGHGYGVIGDGNRRMVYVHRAVYTAMVGPIPVGQQIMHSCDVRNCVNPAHLAPGTRRQNEDDKVRKGRASRGEHRWSAKLTEDGVRDIRLRVAAGERRQSLANHYGVSVGSIDNVVTRKRWRHVV